MNDIQSLEDIFGPPIHVYSRADALRDGVLVDISEAAREAGWAFPVAMTKKAWTETVEWSEADTDRTGCPQDPEGRLWDVLSVGSFTARARGNREGARFPFRLFVVPRDRVVEWDSDGVPEVELDIVVGAGDQGEGVVTIMCPDED